MGRMRRWGLPVLLGVGCLASGGVAAAIEAGVPEPGDPVGGPSLVTPVVSARRLPTVLAAPIAERRLRDDLISWLGSQPADTCLVVEGDEGEISVDHRGEVPLVPASTLKLLTGTAALEVLGPDHRYRTVVEAPAAPADGVVQGDLVLVGGGDPLLASPDYAARYRRQPQVFTDLDALAASVVAAGVTRVEGSVLGDESRYDTARYVAGWPQRYVDQDQIGPLSALAVNDGFAAYPISPDVWAELVAAEDPAREAAAVLTRLLEARGVDVVGEPRAASPRPPGVELAAIESVPMSDVVAQMLRESDNSTAELLIKELGHSAGDPSTAGGLAVATAALAAAGIDTSGVTMADGSGLSLDNRVPCDVLVDVLSGSEPAPTLEAGLAVAAETGTLADRFHGSDAAGVLRAKTGTLNSTTALAGVLDDGDGPLVFGLIANVADGVISAELVAAQEDLAGILADWPRVPDVAVLGPRPLASNGA